MNMSNSDARKRDHDAAHAEFHAKSAAMMERPLGDALRALVKKLQSRRENGFPSYNDWHMIADLTALLAAHEQAPSEGLTACGARACTGCSTCGVPSLGFPPAPERDTEPSGGLTEVERRTVDHIRKRWSHGPTGRYPEFTEQEDQRDIENLLSLVHTLAARTQAPTERLCSQCSERMSCMVKIGTSDGWCTVCLDEAAQGEAPTDVAEGGLVERVRAALVPSLVPCYVTHNAAMACTDWIGSPFGNGVWLEAMCCLPCRLRALLAPVRDSERAETAGEES